VHMQVLTLTQLPLHLVHRLQLYTTLSRWTNKTTLSSDICSCHAFEVLCSLDSIDNITPFPAADSAAEINQVTSRSGRVRCSALLANFCKSLPFRSCPILTPLPCFGVAEENVAFTNFAEPLDDHWPARCRICLLCKSARFVTDPKEVSGRPSNAIDHENSR